MVGSPRGGRACSVGRQGSEGRRARVPVERRDRRVVDCAGLQPGRVAGSGRWRPWVCRRRRSCSWRSCRCCFIAASYYYMNRADPDAGTTFSWVTRAMGPWLGWLGGWAIIVADVIVMANLSQIAGIYSFLLVRADSYAASTFWVTLVGVVWIVVMTAICYIGVELSRAHPVAISWLLRSSRSAIFAVVALWEVYVDTPGRRRSSPTLLDQPVRHPQHQCAHGGRAGCRLHLLGLGQHVTVNEESNDPSRGPGRGGGRRDASSCSGSTSSSRSPPRRSPAPEFRWSTTLTTCSRRWEAGASAHLGQAPIIAVLTSASGVDPDDDPADHPHRALDGVPRCAARDRSPAPPGASTPRRPTTLGWAACRSHGTWG